MTTESPTKATGPWDTAPLEQLRESDPEWTTRTPLFALSLRALGEEEQSPKRQ